MARWVLVLPEQQVHERARLLLKINRLGLILLSLEARNGATPHEKGDCL